MSTLYLVRHGQASFFADDYDKLSEMGEAQARKLGEFWVRHDVAIGEVYHGTLERQKRTAEIVGEVYRAAGKPWPEAIVSPDYNEYPADDVMKLLLPQLMEQDEKFRQLSEANSNATEPRERYRHFHRLLEAVMDKWVHGEYERDGAGEGFESWEDFSGRVRRGLKQIAEAPGGGRQAALFSSGGPIGTAVATVMRAPDPLALQLNWRVHNGSVSEIAFSGPRFTLSSFNSIAHLDEPALWTYR